jgi:hypothetical protein
VTQPIASKGMERLVDLESRKCAASWCEAAHFQSCHSGGAQAPSVSGLGSDRKAEPLAGR